MNAFAMTLVFRLPDRGGFNLKLLIPSANIAPVGVPVLIAREIFSKLSMENFPPDGTYRRCEGGSHDQDQGHFARDHSGQRPRPQSRLLHRHSRARIRGPSAEG